MNINSLAKELLSSALQPAMKTSNATSLLSSNNLDAAIYVADLPLTVRYGDLIEVFEKEIGPCEAVIKRHLFKNFHFAYVNFKDASLGNPLYN